MGKPSGLQIDRGSIRATLIKLRHTVGAIPDLADRAAEAMAGELTRLVRSDLSFTDHTLKDLAAKDHPYARRHGRIRLHGGKPFVHTRSGQMRDALVGQLDPAEDGGAMVYFDLSQAPHAAYVVEGTDKMLPRDVLYWRAGLPTTKKRLLKVAVQALGRDMRSKVGIRLG